MLRAGARHHGVDGHPFHVVAPGFVRGGGLHFPHRLVRGVAGPLEHFGHAGLGRQHDGETVGPLVFQEKAVQVLLRVGGHHPGGGPFDESFFGVLGAEGEGEGGDDLIEDGLARQRVVPLEELAAGGRRDARDRVWYEGEAQVGHPLLEGVGFDEFLEHPGDDRGGGDSKLFDCPAVADDRRRTGASMPDPHDHAVPLLLISAQSAGSSSK